MANPDSGPDRFLPEAFIVDFPPVNDISFQSNNANRVSVAEFCLIIGCGLRNQSDFSGSYQSALPVVSATMVIPQAPISRVKPLIATDPYVRLPKEFIARLITIPLHPTC